MTQWRNPDGELELVMFGDYECPDTAAAWPNVERLLGRFGERLRLGWRHYPVPRLHPHAEPAAEAAESAASQGCFWALHPLLLAHGQEGLDEPRLLALAAAAGADAARVRAELAAGTHAEAVLADKEAGRAIGLRRTPTFVIAGERWDGFYDVESLTEALG